MVTPDLLDLVPLEALKTTVVVGVSDFFCLLNSLGVRRQAERDAALDSPSPTQSGVALRLPPHSKASASFRS